MGVWEERRGWRTTGDKKVYDVLDIREEEPGLMVEDVRREDLQKNSLFLSGGGAAIPVGMAVMAAGVMLGHQ